MSGALVLGQAAPDTVLLEVRQCMPAASEKHGAFLTDALRFSFTQRAFVTGFVLGSEEQRGVRIAAAAVPLPVGVGG